MSRVINEPDPIVIEIADSQLVGPQTKRALAELARAMRTEKAQMNAAFARAGCGSKNLDCTKGCNLSICAKGITLKFGKIC